MHEFFGEGRKRAEAGVAQSGPDSGVTGCAKAPVLQGVADWEPEGIRLGRGSLARVLDAWHENGGQMSVCTEGVLSKDVFWKGGYLDLAVGPTTPVNITKWCLAAYG